MKALRIGAIIFAAVVVLYLVVIAFIPEWMIVGVRFLAVEMKIPSHRLAF
jgi:hypothetical protein